MLRAMLFAGALLISSGSAAADEPDSLRVYVGTYTKGPGEGIPLLELDRTTGKLTKTALAAEVSNPSFLAIHPSRKFLYCVNEVSSSDGRPTGAVTAFAIDPKDGGLKPLNHKSSGGPGPCHLVVDAAGKTVLVANYGGGSVESLKINDDGSLADPTTFIQHRGGSVDKSRQDGPHAHSINLDAANRFAVVADLGLDQVLVYRFDPAAGTLSPNDPPSTSVAPASGPRHFAFHPDGKHAYVINEMKNTVTAFDYDRERGVLREIQTIGTLPNDFKGRSHTAEVQVHPSGRWLYGSNRGHDSLAIFAIAVATGKLTSVGHQSTGGKTPRNFGIDPSGRFVLAANQGSNSIVVFRVDSETGLLTETSKLDGIPSPVCVKFVPAP